MERIRIVGVPEHFNFPWVETIKQQPFRDRRLELVWEDESRGSGAMNKAIRNGDADIALILTESFVKDRVEGNPGKIIGFHVLSPLIWGIHVPAGAGVTGVSDLERIPFLVSRMGSGSHLMAYLFAKQQNWPADGLAFETVNNLDGAMKAFESGKPQAFLWEKYTTKPLVDRGLFERLGEIPTPWPCFVIVASETALANYGNEIKAIRDFAYHKSKSCMDNVGSTIREISKNYQLREEDVAAWFSQTVWATNEDVSKADLSVTLDILQELSLIKQKIHLEELVAEDFVNLI